MSEARFDPAGVLRRSILIVIVAAVAGAAVAGGLTLLRSKTTYTATASIVVDPIAISSYPRIPKPDAMLPAKDDPAVVSAIAEDAGISESDVSAGLNVFTTGNPQDRIRVTFTAPDKAIAEKAAQKAAEEVVGYTLERVEPQLITQRGVLDADLAALERLQKNPPQGDEAMRANLQWSLERALASDKDTYDWLSNTYSYPGGVDVQRSSRTMALAQALLAGALAGLFLGVVVAAVRETARRRSA